MAVDDGAPGTTLMAGIIATGIVGLTAWYFYRKRSVVRYYERLCAAKAAA